LLIDSKYVINGTFLQALHETYTEVDRETPRDIGVATHPG
jgi:hypothetical protein